MQNYKVVLRDDSERQVKADSIQVESNQTLWFISEAGERFLAYAPGEWRSVEIAVDLPEPAVEKKAAKK